ncbi:type IA DNA topoisomerase [Mangrovibacterium lignilyticum]|uniref:type IA DNA topoisomerase n=1 Tax=Mangrovibacterium lignilyticum TaxID=2668052 RepID=UPI0013D6B1B8|nr:type IA DNA topoisomerase [Mangrovibacterium lignilyticum]
MKLCIAEKPSVAKEIAQILGARTRRDGYFEGNGYQVSWTFGHLCTLKEPHDYTDKWKYWDMRYLPMIPPRFGIKVIDDGGVKKQFNTLEKLIGEADEIVNCGDAGQEGELIQRWVLTKAVNKAPVKRLWISSLTEEAIREGFDKLHQGEEFDKLYEAGSARAIGDWLLGMNATRAYTLKYGQNKQVLSIGRVQTPTLAMIVERQLEIENFKPVPYWEVKTTYRDTVFSATSGRFQKPEDAQTVLAEISGIDLYIGNIETKNSNEHPPRLFDLTSLQIECNRKFSMSADDTLRTIQSLYEKKVTTYPRVDTTFLSDDIYKKVPSILKNMKGYESLTQPIIGGGKIRKSKKVFDNKKITDHHAIIPTGQNRIDLSDAERKVFELVCKRFIAVFYPDCKVANTNVEATIGQHNFKTTGKQILAPGWRVVFQNEAKDDNSEDRILPAFTTGEHGPHQPDLQEKQTQPPQYFTEATLLRAMETAGKNMDDEELRELMKENGIGRPSTRANIIETLFRRRYIQKERKRLVATPTGVELIGSIENDLLKSAELTGQWERKLRQIESGELEIALFMEEMKTMVSDVINQVKSSPRRQITILEDEETLKAKAKEEAKLKKQEAAQKVADDLTCPKCGKGQLLKGNSAWGCSGWKAGCRFTIPFAVHEKKLTDKQVATLSTKRKTPLIKGFSFDDLKIDGKLILNASSEIVLQTEIKADSSCPKCNVGKIIKGKTAYGCTNFKGGCSFRVPFEIES